MQTLFLALLAFFARSIIEIKKPYVIGVTGTVGKTTISAHLAQYLMRECGNREVMHSPYHYNGEYGLPLTIIWAKTGGKNPIRWIWVFLVAVYRLMVRYPRYIVLEYGIDHPGEMDFLLSIVEPDIAIITEIMPNHIEQFKTLEAYRWEKLKLGNQAKILIAHESLRQYIEKEALYYWRWAMSEIDASHTRIDDQWTHAIVHAYQKDYPILVPVFWAFQIDNLLPLYGVAHAIWVNLDHIAHYAQTFTPESGRSWILRGINHSTIIDGSYNGGYLSIHSGISSMRSFLSSHRLVFLLGDMRELWDQTEDMHTQLGREILSIFPHEKNVYFFLVWPSMGEYVKPILASAFQTLHTLSSREAGEHIAELLKKSKDTSTMVYVKWSQNTIFLEEGIKLFLDPHEDTSKLCRQTPDWMKKKEIFFRNLNKSKAPK
jgi:UDP-N-acetylmuramoyl-tripeptide--D-alanyl-D-alanine ligase